MRRPVSPRLISLIAVIAAAAIGATSCATTSSAPPGPSQPGGSRSSPPASAPVTPSTSATPAACPGGWRATSLTVTRQVAVPPVPVATAIRAGSHPGCRFDRLVIDLSGAMPGYSVGFVPNVIQDPSGRAIAMPGTSFLRVTLKPAQGHTADGKPTLPVKVESVGYPMLKSFAVAGDFEGVLSVALGLAGGSKYRVGELPGRLYVDVAW